VGNYSGMSTGRGHHAEKPLLSDDGDSPPLGSFLTTPCVSYRVAILSDFVLNGVQIYFDNHRFTLLWFWNIYGHIMPTIDHAAGIPETSGKSTSVPAT